MKIYLNHTTTERGTSAAEAMSWHRAGDLVQVLTYDDNGKELADVMVKGAPVYHTRDERLDENTRHCKAIAKDVNAYAAGDVHKCPECGALLNRDDWDDMDVFRCPECGHVDDVDAFDVQSIWDYLDDVLNVEFRVDSSKELRSVQIMVACGGPNIYLDTASRDVELYWWTESARWPLSTAAVEALDDWAEEYWGCL